MSSPAQEAFIIDYNTQKYNFREWACAVLGMQDIENIHERPDIKRLNSEHVARQIEIGRKALTDDFPILEPLYVDFLNSVIAPLFGGIISFQKPPSFRLHYSRKGSSSFHRDRDYGVLSGRLNLWVPLTKVWGTNSLWIESDEGKKDYTPVELLYGQALIFDGANLSHGSKWNSTKSSRVSFDVRFAPAHPFGKPPMSVYCPNP